MLTTEEKNAIIDSKLKEYETRIFYMEINKVALLATGDTEGVAITDKSISDIVTAMEAVRKMKV